MSYQLLFKRKIKKRKKVEEYKDYVYISDNLLKRATKSVGTSIETEVYIIELPSTKFKLKTVENLLKSKVFKLDVLPKLFKQIRYESVFEIKPTRYILKMKLNNFKSLKFPPSNLQVKKFRSLPLSFSNVSVSSFVNISKKYLLASKLAFMKRKARVGINMEGIGSVLELGSTSEYGVLNKIDLGLFVSEESKAIFGGSKYVGEPIVFVLNDDLWYFIAKLCKEIYREVRGEFPKPHIINIEEKEDFEEFITLVELGEKVAKDIIIIRFLSNDVKPYTNNPKFKKIMKRVVNELFSQGLGFLILTVNPRSKEASNILDELEGKVLNEFSEFHILKLIKIKTLSIEVIPIIEEFMKVIYGIKKFTQKPLERGLRVIGCRIAEAERLYRDLIDDTLRFNKYLYKVKLHKVNGKKESEDHLALKALAVKNLVENYGVELSDIETEYVIGDNVVADVYVKSLNWVIEVETLFDTGAVPILKIRDTVLKYKKVPVRKIWVVIRNMPALIHFQDLLKLLKYLRHEMKGTEIEFHVINVKNKNLVNVLEIRNQMLQHLSKVFLKARKHKECKDSTS